MPGMSGADVEAVRQFAVSVQQAADRLSMIQQGIGNAIDVTPWRGDDAKMFESIWVAEHSPFLAQCAQRLNDTAGDLQAQAQQQEVASSADGGSWFSPNNSQDKTHGNDSDTFDNDPNDIFGNGRKPEVLDRPLFNTIDGMPVVTHIQIEQGALGDCWLVASLKAIAFQQPNLIKDAITENADGTFTVRLYEDGKPVYVTVDRSVITDGNGDPSFADNPYGSLWPTIYEKAVAKHYGGYDNINGGNAADALELLTGKKTSNDNLQDKDMFWNRDRSIEDIRDYLNNDGLIVADTLSGDKAKGRDWYGPSPDHPSLVDSHTYVVESVNVKDNTITILNPHAGGQRITMPFDEFEENFSDVNYNPGK